MVLGENNNNNAGYEGFIQGQLDAESVADKIAMLLRGHRFDPNERKFTNKINVRVLDPETKKYILEEREAEPLLNEQGVMDVVTEIRARIANVNASASLTADQIKTSRMGIADVLWTKLRINRVQYELKVENIKAILYIVDDTIMLFLSRTEKGGFLKTLARMIGRKENVNMNVTEDAKSGTLTKNGGLFN